MIKLFLLFLSRIVTVDLTQLLLENAKNKTNTIDAYVLVCYHEQKKGL